MNNPFFTSPNPPQFDSDDQESSDELFSCKAAMSRDGLTQFPIAPAAMLADFAAMHTEADSFSCVEIFPHSVRSSQVTTGVLLSVHTDFKGAKVEEALRNEAPLAAFDIRTLAMKIIGGHTTDGGYMGAYDASSKTLTLNLQGSENTYAITTRDPVVSFIGAVKSPSTGATFAPDVLQAVIATVSDVVSPKNREKNREPVVIRNGKVEASLDSATSVTLISATVDTGGVDDVAFDVSQGTELARGLGKLAGPAHYVRHGQQNMFFDHTTKVSLGQANCCLPKFPDLDRVPLALDVEIDRVWFDNTMLMASIVPDLAPDRGPVKDLQIREHHVVRLEMKAQDELRLQRQTTSSDLFVSEVPVSNYGQVHHWDGSQVVADFALRPLLSFMNHVRKHDTPTLRLGIHRKNNELALRITDIQQHCILEFMTSAVSAKSQNRSAKQQRRR